MARVPCFNDGSAPADMDVVTNGGRDITAHPSLRTPVTTYGRQVRYTVYEFEELLDSSSINAKGWAEIAQTIFQNYTFFDGFVVLHGTDSLAYSCSALSFMLQNLGKPVVLTGSQAPMLQLQNDATDNLLGSLVVAGHFMIPEVCLYFNNKLFRGNRSTKVAASDFAAFDAPNCPPLAVTTSMRTNVNWDMVHRPTTLEHFRIQTNLDTAHVACLRIFPGIKPEMVDAVLKLDGLRGLVLETFGAGNAPSGQDNAMINVLAAAIRRGIVIVNVTQCEQYSTPGLYERHILTDCSPHRSDRQCQPGLCHGNEPLPGRGRSRPRHDHRGGIDETGVLARITRIHPGICGQEHVSVIARRVDRVVAARLPSSRWRAARARADADGNGVRHCARRSRTGQDDPQDRTSLAAE